MATATAWPGSAFDGKVISLLPEVDAQTRTLTARVQLKNTDRRLAPGMFVSLQFTSATNEPQLSVPTEAVIATGERSVVVVTNDDGSFNVADVTTGREMDGRTEILKGLTEGQSIVLSGQFLIDSEASLKATVSRLGATEAGATQKMEMSDQGMSHRAQGTITAIDDKTITLDHGAVASLNWPPMVMAFIKPPDGAPADLKVGDHVMFSFKQVDGGYQLESISRSEAAMNGKGTTP